MNKRAEVYQVWEERWRGMHESMQYWLEMANKGEQHFERQETLMSLLASLQAFGKSQMDFFLDGLEEKSKYRLEPSAYYPWEYVFRTTVDQIGFDLDVLLRAAQQRMASLMPSGLLETLDLADRLAYQALKPALDHGLIDHDTTVVTYFQKSVNVRLVPYAPVVMIGIPFSAMQSRRELLAIPHEVGHYVFRDGRIRSGRFADSRFSAALHSRFARQPVWFNGWLEEIFADVYGCLIAGPVVALSFMEMVTDDPVDEFTVLDGEHPAAAVRPQVYFSTLRRMKGFDQALKQLTDVWQALFVERGDPKDLQLPGVAHRVAIDETIAEMDSKVIETILQEQFLGALLPTQDHCAHPLWSTELQDGQEVNDLHHSFAAYIAAMTPPDSSLPELRRSAPAKMRIVKGKPETHDTAKGVEQRIGTTGLWIDAIKEMANLTAQQGDPVLAVPEEIWTLLLDAGGWATEGPGGTNLHS